MRRVLYLLGIIFSSLAVPLDAQTIRGLLLDAESGVAIEAGTMVLLSEDSVPVQSLLTGADGGFLLTAPGGGTYRLSAQRIGYRTAVSPSIDLGDRDTLEVEFRLSTQAVALQPITVVGYSGRPSGALGGFYERMERGGFGTFISREQIEERHPFNASDLLRTVPGLRLVPDRWGRMIALMRGRCVPQIYLDVMRIHSISVDDLVHPMDLEGIEIYRGPGQLPAEFFGPAMTCGAIVLWTRRGG